MNTQVGHMDRNIKIISGPDTSTGLDFIVYGYYDQKMHWIGSMALVGVHVQGINTVQYINVINGTYASTITQSSFANSLTSFVSIQNSNQISFTNNIFFRSSGSGVFASNVKSFIFSNNLMMGVQSEGCYYSEDYFSPSTSGVSIKNNFCLGSAGYGFAFPHIQCSEL
jgi:hypothetical protein